MQLVYESLLQRDDKFGLPEVIRQGITFFRIGFKKERIFFKDS